jgi:outer membrane receptor protein involved in Fe transport
MACRILVNIVASMILLSAHSGSWAEVAGKINTNKHDFNIADRPLAKALQTFAQQANIAISTPHLTYKDGKSELLQGRFTIKAGLERLLQNSSFTYKILSSRAIKIYKSKQSTPHQPKQLLASPIDYDAEVDLIEEILVTSARRTETIFSVPTSVSIFSPKPNEQFGSLDTLDLTRKVSGSHNSLQNPGQNKLILRGLSDGAFNGRAQSLVSTYIDNSRIIYNTPDPSLGLIDIDQVEVLRGPQGTLYGSGALSGLYKITTRKPDFEDLDIQLASSLSTTAGGDQSYDLSGIINLPLVKDKLALRAVVLYRDKGGYIDNTQLNLEDINSSETTATRIAVSYQFNNNLSLTLGFNYQDFISNDNNYFIEGLPPFSVDNNFQEPFEDELTQPNLTIDANLGWATLTSSTTWLNRDINSVLDASTTIIRRFSDDNATGTFESIQNVETISNETHLTSPLGGRLEWVLGTFFSHRRESNDSALFAQADILSLLDFTQIPDIPPGAIFFEGRFETLTELAIFGEATYYLSDKVSVTSGLRWFSYDGDAFSRVRSLGSNDTIGLTGSQLDNDFIPKVSFSYYASDDLTLYSQFSVGWRLGGTNLLGSSINFAEIGFIDENNILDNFASDSLLNYEIGAKYISPDNNLHASFASFFSSWQDIQSYQFSPDGIPDIDNVGDAIVYGFDVEFSYTANDALKIDANVAWNRSEITNTTNRFGAQSGDRLPGAPAFTAGISLQNDFTLNNHPFSLNTSYNYVGSTRLLFETEATPRADQYHLINLAVSTNLKSFNITLFANNLFNSRANTFPFSNPFNLEIANNGFQSRQVTPLTPRTIGVAINWQY